MAELDYINVSNNGAVGNGLSDDSQYFTQLKGVILPYNLTYAVNKYTILGIDRKYVIGTGKIKWKDFKVSLSHTIGFNDDEVDGIIPVDKLNDEIYLSMNLPCEAITYPMTFRTNPGIMYSMADYNSKIMGTGTIYKNPDKELPAVFTLCLGKMKVFILQNNNQQWILGDDLPYPNGLKLFHESWDETTKECTNINYFDDHVEVVLTSTEFSNHILHFWSNYISDIDYTKFTAVAIAFDYWIKEEGLDDHFVAGVACDFKDTEGTYDSINQAFFSRYMLVKHNRRTIWGHNVSNANYDTYMDSTRLLSIYEHEYSRSMIEVINTRANKDSDHEFMYNTYRGALYCKQDLTNDSLITKTEINPIKRLNLPVNLIGNTANLKLASILVPSNLRQLYIVKISLWGGISNDTKSDFFAGDFILRIRTGINPEASITEISNGLLSRDNLLKVQFDGDSYNIYVSGVLAWEQVQALVCYINTDNYNVLNINPLFFTAYSGYSSIYSGLWSLEELTGNIITFEK